MANEEQYIPSYLHTPLDFKNDSVVRHCEKLACRAHGGKYIESLFESPMPACINPLSSLEALEWGDAAMKFEKKVETLSFKRGSGRKISIKKDYVPHTPFKAFFGYKSEPPVARVFSEDEPVGPAASALKAAGTLIAILESSNEDSSIVTDLFMHAWGRDLTSLRKYITPDATNTSRRDIVKLTRSTTHSLYGFQSEQPSGKLDLGVYRPATMREQVYMDYHRISLAVRFIGEWASKYNKAFVPLDGGNSRTIYFAPVLSEFPIVLNNRLRPRIPVELLSNNRKLASLATIVDNTFSYYTEEVSALRLASQLGLSRILGSDTELWANVSIRSLITTNRKDVVRPIMANIHPKDSADILKRANDKPATFMKSSVTATFNMTAHRALITTIAAYMVSEKSVKNAATLLSYADTKFLEMKAGTITTNDYLNGLVSSLPKNLFATSVNVLTAGSVSRSDAEGKMVNYLASICNLDKVLAYEDLKPNNFLTYSFLEANDMETLRRIVQAARNDYRTSSHMSSAIKFRPLATDDVRVVILDAVNEYMKKKTKYWIIHYRGRVMQASMSLSAKPEANKVDFLKKTSIVYNYLAMIYKIVDFEYKSDDTLSYTIDSKKYQRELLRSLGNHERKRSKKKTAKEFDMDLFISKNMILVDGIKVINSVFDQKFKVKVPYSSLWSTAKKKLLVTVNSAQKAIANRIANSEYTEEMDEEDDKVAMEEELGEMENKDFLNWIIDDYDNEVDQIVLNGEEIDYNEPVEESKEVKNDYSIDTDTSKVIVTATDLKVEANLESLESLLNIFGEETMSAFSTDIDMIQMIQTDLDPSITPSMICKATLLNVDQLRRYIYDGTYQDYVTQTNLIIEKVSKYMLATRVERKVTTADIL